LRPLDLVNDREKWDELALLVQSAEVLAPYTKAERFRFPDELIRRQKVVLSKGPRRAGE
jgi:hypothetical protein